MSNYWHRPGVMIKLIHEKDEAPNGAIELSVTMTDFLQALFTEMGHPEVERDFASAITKTLEKIKHATIGNIQ
jgi:hypothetical protein